MNLAIHHEKNSFSERWIDYCNTNDISYKLVNCYENNIIEQLEGIDVLLFNWWHHDVKAALFMRQLTYSIELKGISVFPDSNTSWHYDDKVGQKYLLEAVNAPLIPSYVFYDQKTALEWVKNTSFPKVFKLRGGAGAMNVKLVKSEKQARNLIAKAFSSGFSVNNRIALFKDRILKLKQKFNIANLQGLFKGLARLFVPTAQEKMQPKEKGYVYFQEFIPNNDCDIRIIVIGDKAFGIKRFVREGDFRASGSGNLSYAKDDIDVDCIKIAFETTKKMKAQSVAFDFVFMDEKPLIVEVSYAFSIASYDRCEGYWLDNMDYIEGEFNPQHFMLQNLLKNYKTKY